MSRGIDIFKILLGEPLNMNIVNLVIDALINDKRREISRRGYDPDNLSLPQKEQLLIISIKGFLKEKVRQANNSVVAAEQEYIAAIELAQQNAELIDEEDL